MTYNTHFSTEHMVVARPISSLQLPQSADSVDNSPSLIHAKILQNVKIQDPLLTVSLPIDEVSFQPTHQRSDSSNSQKSCTSTLSHITVLPRSSAASPELPIDHGLVPTPLADEIFSDKRRSSHEPNGLLVAEPSNKPPNIVRECSTKPLSRLNCSRVSQTFEDESDDEIPLIVAIREQRKRKRQAPSQDKPITKDPTEDGHLRKLQKRRKSKPQKARLNRMVWVDEDLDNFVSDFEYNTRAKSMKRSTTTSSSPVKEYDIIYDCPEDVDVESAQFPVKVKHPTLPGTLWEIKNIEDLKDEIDSRRVSSTSHAAGLSSVPPMVDATTGAGAVKSNRVLLFLDQAEKQFSDSLFFVIGTCMHARDMPLTRASIQIIDDAAQDWLAVLRSGRAEFERKVQNLGILDIGIQGKNGEIRQAFAVEGEEATVLAHGNIEDETSLLHDQNEEAGTTLMHGTPVNDQARAERVPDVLAEIFEPIATHLEAIPHIARDRHLTREQKRAEICACLILVGDFIEKKYSNPLGQTMQTKLWHYFGNKSWNYKEDDMQAVKALRAAYEREKSVLATKKTADNHLAKKQHPEQEDGYLDGRQRKGEDQTQWEEGQSPQEVVLAKQQKNQLHLEGISSSHPREDYPQLKADVQQRNGEGLDENQRNGTCRKMSSKTTPGFSRRRRLEIIDLSMDADGDSSD
jgi:hypothetical protein